MGKLLSFEAILKADDLRTEEITVPAWGGPVRVGVFTKAQQVQMQADAATIGPDGKPKVDMGRMQKQILLHGLVEPKLTPGQVDAVFTKSAEAVDVVLNAIMRLNGLGAGGAVSEEAVAAEVAAFPEQS